MCFSSLIQLVGGCHGYEGTLAAYSAQVKLQNQVWGETRSRQLKFKTPVYVCVCVHVYIVCVTCGWYIDLSRRRQLVGEVCRSSWYRCLPGSGGSSSSWRLELLDELIRLMGLELKS